MGKLLQGAMTVCGIVTFGKLPWIKKNMGKVCVYFIWSFGKQVF